MTLNEIITKISDGKHYQFTNPGLQGYFEKAPFPAQKAFTNRDGALSAITYRNLDGSSSSPVLLLDDFNRNDWTIKEICTSLN